MTYPHIEPEFHHISDIPDYLRPEHIKRVQDVNNAVLEAWLNCDAKGADCFECGKSECFEAFKAQAELLGMTFKDYVDSIKRQREIDRKAAEAQTLRYEHYRRQFEAMKNSEASKPEQDKTSLFNFEKVA